MSDNFNLENISETAQKIVLLFDEKKDLTHDEIVDGLYRRFKIIKNNVSIGPSLFRLRKKGILKFNNSSKTHRIVEKKEVVYGR